MGAGVRAMTEDMQDRNYQEWEFLRSCRKGSWMRGEVDMISTAKLPDQFRPVPILDQGERGVEVDAEIARSVRLAVGHPPCAAGDCAGVPAPLGSPPTESPGAGNSTSPLWPLPRRPPRPSPRRCL